MGLRFIYGCSGCGKTDFCMNSIQNLIKKEFPKPILLIVPEQYSFQAEKKLISSIGESGLLKVQVLSFKRLAYRVFSEIGGISRNRMNPSGKNMLLYNIIDENKDNLQMFKRIGREKGFVDIMADTITEFKRYDITPGSLESAMGRIDDEELKEKLHDINFIFKSFEEKISSGYIDPDDDLTYLAKKLQKSDMFSGAEIWFDEFSTFTPQQYDIISILLKRARRVNITLCCDCLSEGNCTANTDVFMPVKNTENKLLRICMENNIAYEEPVELNKQRGMRFSKSGELLHLEKNYFSYPNKIYEDKTESLSIFMAKNLYTEVENLAKNIIRLSREQNVRFNKMAVITRNLDAYSKLIQVIFEEYDIPYFIDQKRDINKNPLMVLVNSVIEIYARSWSYEAVFRYLKTGLTDIPAEDIDILENYVLLNGIRGDKWTADSDWNYKLTGEFDNEPDEEYAKEALSRINAVRRQISSPLIRLFDGMKGQRTVKEICSALYEFISSLGIPEKLEMWVNEFKKQGLHSLAREYAQTWDNFLSLLDQLVEVMGEEVIEPKKLIKIFQAGLSRCKVGIIPSALDQVLIGDVERVKSQEAEYVFIIGVNDGVFPRVPMDEGILSDRDRNTLRGQGLELAEDTRVQAFEEQFLVYKALTISSRLLRLSYPVSNTAGESLRPSIIISRIKKIYRNITVDSDVIARNTTEENMENISRPGPTFNELVSVMRADYEDIKADPVWWDVFRWYRNNPIWNERCRKAVESFSYTNQVHNINSEKISRLYGNPLYMSVSRIEKYVECPFAFYVQYGLKARNRKVYEFNSPDAGSFMHEVMNEFSETLKKENMSWRDIDKDWCCEAVSIIVDKVSGDKKNFVLDSNERYRYFKERYKRIISRAVWTICEHIKGSNFEPQYYEKQFGTKNEELPPVEVNLPSGGKVYFNGRIDRIDTYKDEEGTYIRIIDYKSSKTELRLSDIYYGFMLQLILYLDVVLSNADEFIDDKALPGAMLYFRLDDPLIEADEDETAEQIEKMVTKSLKMTGLVLDDIKVIKGMDKDIGYKNSYYIPVNLTKQDTVISTQSRVATSEDFQTLRNYARNLLVKICEEMLKGNISIKPCKNANQSSCAFCEYSSICGFDSAFKDNKYKFIKDIKDEEALILMKDALAEEADVNEGGGKD